MHEPLTAPCPGVERETGGRNGSEFGKISLRKELWATLRQRTLSSSIKDFFRDEGSRLTELVNSKKYWNKSGT